jgi:hypothetical protein
VHDVIERRVMKRRRLSNAPTRSRHGRMSRSRKSDTSFLP